MSNQFNTRSEVAGFRLQYMELLNWGTFDKQIFRIAPTGNNSLLTGANGSGKTTFVDALVTLLVPLKKDRFYNQSSGVEKKGDRTEDSYVLGHYGNIQKDGELSARTQSLRKKEKAHSVLLANFLNASDKTITLFQVRYFSNGQLKRVFGLAHQAMTIAVDFSNFDNRGNWRRRLDSAYNTNAKRKQLEFFRGPTEYANRLTRLFGMRSLRALNLFNQVVGIKVLGDLNDFIRQNMLVGKDTEAHYIELKESFLTLMKAKNNIDKAKEQIAQLKPVNDYANRLTETKAAIQNAQLEKREGGFWFAQKEKELCRREIEQLTTKITVLDDAIILLKEQQEELREQEAKLRVQIRDSEVGKQIRELEKEIRELAKKRDNRQGKLEKYNAVAQKLALTVNPNETIFYQQREQAKAQKQLCEKAMEQVNEELRQAKNMEDALAKQLEEGMRTVRMLQANKNNISGRVAEIRNELLTVTGATKEEIPFIGELIKVDEPEKAWEGAIEKVLHNFALRLIVPEKYYRPVNQYVNETNLGGRITYQRYRERATASYLNPPNPNPNALIHKLSFKPQNPYKDWVEHQINTQFNYTCADSLESFNRLEKAITKNRLIKFGHGKHEKDDRRWVLSKENYVLGWDNKEKLAWWRQEIKRIQTELQTNRQAIKKL
ncbi:MAG: ATP-binding protein, partial [Bacteroidota bacterium]